MKRRARSASLTVLKSQWRCLCSFAILLVSPTWAGSRTSANSGTLLIINSRGPSAADRGVALFDGTNRSMLNSDAQVVDFLCGPRLIVSEGYGTLHMTELSGRKQSTTVDLSMIDTSFKGGLPDADVSSDGSKLALLDFRGLVVYDRAGNKVSARFSTEEMLRQLPAAEQSRAHSLRGVEWNRNADLLAITLCSREEQDVSGLMKPLACVLDMRNHRFRKVGLGAPRAWLGKNLLLETPENPGTPHAATASLYSPSGKLIAKVPHLFTVAKADGVACLIKLSKDKHLSAEFWTSDLKRKVSGTALRGLDFRFVSPYIVAGH